MRALALALLLLSSSLAAQRGPAEARRAFDKGTQAVRQKRPEDARRYYQTAVQLDPSHARAWFELGRLQSAAGEAEAARRSLEAAICADSKLFDAYVLLAMLAQKARDWHRLIEVSERLMKLNPVDYPVAFLGHGVGNYNLGNKVASEKSLRAAQEIDPVRRFPESWHLLGLILAERGDFAGAAEQWREFLKHAPPSPEAREVEAKLAKAEARANAVAGASSGATFSVKTELALVRFQVSPKRGRFLTDLRAEDIEIREDGMPQKTALFEGGRFYPRTVPLEISLLFDASNSVQSVGNLNPYVFQQNLLGEYENASIAIFGFSNQLVRLTGPTRHPQVLKKAMGAVLMIPTGITPLFGYIGETVRRAAARPGAIRMLIVFSDGESYKPGDEGLVDEAIQAARECGVAIYPVLLRRSVGIPGAGATVSRQPGLVGFPGLSSPLDTAVSVQNFCKLARETGGEQFEAVARNDVLPQILKSMSRRLEYDYIAGYYPVTSGPKKRHEVEVVLKAKQRGNIVGGKRIVVH